VTVVVLSPPPHAETANGTAASVNATARYLTAFTELPPVDDWFASILSD
jgi:hypothetical protein